MDKSKIKTILMSKKNRTNHIVGLCHALLEKYSRKKDAGNDIWNIFAKQTIKKVTQSTNSKANKQS